MGTIIGFLVLFFISAWITVSWVTSGKTVTVPDLNEKNVVDALKEVGQIGLDLRVIREEHNPVVPRNGIIAQYPKSGTQLKADRNIQVVLSLGVRNVAIPDVRGISIRKAELILKQNGLSSDRTTRAYLEGDEKDAVLSQNPMPLVTDIQENTVDLLVSEGPRLAEYRMPDLIGMDFNQAVTLLESASLVIGNVRHEEYPGAKENQITNQYPHFGYPASQDTNIVLVVQQKTASPRGATVTRIPFMYRIPFRIPFPIATDIFLEDNLGRKRIYTGRKFPGSQIELTLEIAGEGVVEVYLNGKKVQSREYR
jgi:serine/threonine-protein kinase